MPLSWNEIKDRALTSSREWKGEGSERAEAQSFWNGFFGVFGIDRRRVAIAAWRSRVVCCVEIASGVHAPSGIVAPSPNTWPSAVLRSAGA